MLLYSMLLYAGGKSLYEGGVAVYDGGELYAGGLAGVVFSAVSSYDEPKKARAAQKLLRLSESRAADLPSTVTMLMLALVLIP